MPRGDGTGPRGKGPMSGKRAGRCSGNNPAAVNNRNQQGGLFSIFRGMFSDSSNRVPGSGQGSGTGRGRGMGQGIGRSFSNFTGYEKQGTAATQILNKDRSPQEAAQLRERARQIEEELNALQRKINDLESKKPVSKVLVNKELCIGCGKCEDVCPQGAISVKAAAEVDQGLCTLCGRCINECPVEALRIV